MKITVDPKLDPILINSKFFFDNTVENWLDRYSVPAVDGNGLEIEPLVSRSNNTYTLSFGWETYRPKSFQVDYFPIFPSTPNAMVREVQTLKGQFSGGESRWRVSGVITSVDWRDETNGVVKSYQIMKAEFSTPVAVSSLDLDLPWATKLSGNDEVRGSSGNDVISGFSGNDTLDGGRGDDTIFGGAGSDVLDGSAGTDSLVGGLDNDTFVIDHVGDRVTELVDEGIDLIRTTLTQVDLIDYVHVENLIYMGRSNTILVGSDINNIIKGGSLNDIIEGGAGSDTLFGGDGADLFFGYYDYDDTEINGVDPAFSDTAFKLESENSIDQLYGGKGNDVYLLDRFVNTPEVIEYRGEGIDTILGDVAQYVMPNHVENYLSDIALSANGVSQYVEIRGNVLNNLIRSSPQWDMPDTAGMDWLATNIKGLLDSTSDVESRDEKFFGMAGNDTLQGGAGDDYLSGGEGRDRLTGGAGADQFLFDVALNRGSNLDSVTDFVSGQDQITLNHGVFARFSAGQRVADHLSITGRALDRDDYLVYSPVNKTLYYDADGSGRGTAVAFAVLTGTNSLSANDFLII